MCRGVFLRWLYIMQLCTLNFSINDNNNQIDK